MKRGFDNKITDLKKQQEHRRIELASLGMLIEKYPEEARQKLLKFSRNFNQPEKELKAS